jgi:hypothetical protein
MESIRQGRKTLKKLYRNCNGTVGVLSSKLEPDCSSLDALPVPVTGLSITTLYNPDGVLWTTFLHRGIWPLPLLRRTYIPSFSPTKDVCPSKAPKGILGLREMPSAEIRGASSL